MSSKISLTTLLLVLVISTLTAQDSIVIGDLISAEKLFDLALSPASLANPTALGPLTAALQALPGVSGVEPLPDGLRVLARSADGLLADIVQTANPYGLRDLAITEASLETVFIRLTGRDLRE